MLTKAHCTAMLPVTDVTRARKFYEEKLGIHAKRALPNGEVLFDSEGTEFALYPREKPVVSDRTALTWDVPDIVAEMRALRERGVRFEEYPEMKTKDGIAEMGGERAAWFKDPDGNILCLHQAR